MSPRRRAVAVSVLVVTYNHARFVRQALDGALAQRLPQPSRSSSPKTARPTARARSCRSTRSAIRTSSASCSPSGISIRTRWSRAASAPPADGTSRCWTVTTTGRATTSCGRRSRSDARPDLTICFHNAQVVDERSQSTGRLWNAPGQPEVSGLHELLRGNFIATSSVVYRRAAVAEVPGWYDGFFRSRIGRCTSSTPARGGSAISTERSAPTACTAADCSRPSASARSSRRTPTSTGGCAPARRALAAEIARGQRDYFFGWAEEFRDVATGACCCAVCGGRGGSRAVRPARRVPRLAGGPMSRAPVPAIADALARAGR